MPQTRRQRNHNHAGPLCSPAEAHATCEGRQRLHGTSLFLSGLRARTLQIAAYPKGHFVGRNHRAVRGISAQGARDVHQPCRRQKPRPQLHCHHARVQPDACRGRLFLLLLIFIVAPVGLRTLELRCAGLAHSCAEIKAADKSCRIKGWQAVLGVQTPKDISVRALGRYIDTPKGVVPSRNC